MRNLPILFFLIYFFLISPAHAQRPDPAPGKNVKTMRVYMVAYGDAGDSTPSILNSAYEYDQKGNPLRKETYRKNVLLMNEPTDSSSQVYYDFAGNAFSNAAEQVYVYAYNDRDSITLEDNWGPSYTLAHYHTEYTYAPDGKMLKEQATDDGQLRYTVLYVYDAKGRLIQENSTYRDAPKISKKMNYKYDKAGNMVQILSRNELGQRYDSSAYVYDSENRRVSGVHYREGVVKDSIHITYSAEGKTVETFKPNAWRGDKITNWKYSMKKYDTAGKMMLELESSYRVSSITELRIATPRQVDSTRYEWWPDGKPKSAIETRTFDDGKRIPKSSKTYDKNGNILEDLLYDNHELWIGYRYTYDAQGRKIKEQWIGYGHQNGYYTFSYNEKGLVTERRHFTKGGHLLEREIYKYTFF